MATNVKFKRSAIESKRPSISQLELGELALNTNDGRVFTRKYNVGIGSTVTLLNVWTENIGGGAYYTDGNIGIGTTLPTSKLTVVGDVLVSGVLTATRLYSGIYGEFVGGFISGSNIVGTSLSITGISTLGTVQISSGIVTATTGSNPVVYYGDGSKLTNVVSSSGYADRAGIATNVIGGIASVTQLNVSGLSTFNNIVGTSLSITGISTIANFRITPIGTGATVGGVGVLTYYGDGSNLSGVSAFSVQQQDITTSPVVYPTFASNIGTSSLGIASTQFVYIPASGNIGIGTTLPTSALSVVGDGVFSGSITASSFNGGPLSSSSGDFSNLIVSGVTTSTGGFIGNLTGTATSTTNIPNLTGAITSVNTTTSLGSFTSANLATALTDETGSGAAVFATSPTLVTPVLGAASATSINVSGIVTATTFVGALTGTATSTTNIPNITGDISSSNTVTTLATVNSNVGTFGGTDAIPVVTVNGKGLVTGISTVAPNNGTLSLGVSGTGLSGSASFTANQSGASTFTVTSNATSDNTNNTIVARDGSGNFSAGTITANLTGTATSTTNIPNLTGAITSVNTTTSLGSFTSANLAAALTDETGSGANVFATSPTLVTPILGTPQSGTLTNCTGLPVSTGISGLAANVATFLTTPSSANLISAVTDETGTGALVFATSPTLVTPVLGAASATSVTASGTITANSYNVGADVGITTTRTTVATTSATTIDSFAIATFRSARVQVQITQSTNYQTSDVLIIHNGTTADVVEYGAIATNDYLGTFSAIVSGGNCLLQINMSSATSSTVKVLSQRITV